MEKVLTVSIAAYNVEKYLQQTLESLVNNEIEVLIIDDGSKDKTANIAYQYEKRFPGIFKLIRKSNGGHGSTINKGIELAQGKYFKIIDGDDWVNNADLVKLVDKLKMVDEDLILTHHVEVYEDSNTTNLCKATNNNFDKRMQFKEIILENPFCMHQWCVKTELLKQNNIFIDENCFYVDNEFTLFCVPLIESVRVLDLIVYMYRLGNVTQSVSSESTMRHIDDLKRVVFSLIDNYQKSNYSPEKDVFVTCQIAGLARKVLNTYLSSPLSDVSVKEKLSDFCEEVQKASSTIYSLMSEHISYPLHMENLKYKRSRKRISDRWLNFLLTHSFFSWQLYSISRKNK